MATVYSLICWGGLTGKSVTGVVATDIITSTKHGLRTGTALVAQSTVSGVTSGTTYYAGPIDIDTFYLYDTLTNAQAAGATGRINITATTAFYLKSKVMLDYMTAYPTRWGASGSEKIYNSLSAWNTARSGASALDTEVCEIGEAFTDKATAALSINVPAAEVLIISSVNSTRTTAHHAGAFLAGYVWEQTGNGQDGLNITVDNATVDGWTVAVGSGWYSTYLLKLTNFGCKAIGMMLYGPGGTTAAGSYGNGIHQIGNGVLIRNCVAVGCLRGFLITQYATGILIGNNTAVKNGTGFSPQGATSMTGRFYGNISVGNTTNWGTAAGFTDAHCNAGLTGESWTSSGRTRLVIATTDFASYPTDLHPATASSPQTDTSIQYYNALAYDVANAVRPSYENGTATEYDVGAYEFDHGYGPWPASQDVTVSGIVSGSRIKIAKQSDGTEIYNSTTAPTAYETTFSTATPVYIYARKGSAATYYHPLKLSATIDPDAGLTYDATGLQQEDIAAHDYSATAVASDWTFNSGTGAIAHASGSTRYSVQDLYSWHQDYYDDSATVDDLPLMHGTTSTIFELINSGTITDADLEDLFGGSIEFGNGDLWSNLWTTDTMAAAHDVYVVQGTSKYTAFWSAGPIDVLLQVSDAGTLRSSGLVDVYARPYGYTYAYYRADLSAGGRTVAPISTLADSAITETSATVGGWTDITVAFSTYSLDFGDGDGSLTYYCRIDCNNRPLSEVYQRAQYLTRSDSTATLNGVEGWRYQSAHTGYVANSQAPFGTYSGGVWALAKGVWLDNVPSGDSLNYIVTDDSGATHQNTVALNQSVTITGVTAGSRVQIYDTTNSVELFNSTTSPYYWEDSLAPAGDRAIRVRISYVSGATAKEFIEQNIGTCGTSLSTKDVSYLASQQDDAVYISNAVSGSTVTGVTFTDSSVDVMNIDISAGVDLPDLYAAWVYYAFTATGIATDIDYIRAIDTANYVYSNLVWKNVTSPSVPLKISGGYAWDAVTEDPMDLIDTTGGTIFLAPPHVVSKVVTVTGGNVITGDVSDILTATLDTNIIKVNGYSVTGDGQTGTEWGPA